jgi:hypothetical protein
MHPGYKAERPGGPKQKDRRHHSYDESSDEPGTLIWPAPGFVDTRLS